jgi:hypothetical protein
MKVKKILSKLDNVCDFVLKSNSYSDFEVRFNYLLTILIDYFEDEMYKIKLPFFSYVVIEKLNNKLNSIITRINKTKFNYSDGILSNDIFLMILKEEYPQYYYNYNYQTFYIQN